jgi:NitT/TauT family transport system substrate-binding protein
VRGVPTSRALVALLAMLIACGGPTAPASKATPASPVTQAPAAAAPAAGPVRPELPNTPVDLKVGIIPLSSSGPNYIAHERGYFQELGLNVELVPTSNVTEQMPPLTQGQLHVGACATNVACFNALHRRADLKIVADYNSAGKTERSSGTAGLVVRKDLWDGGVIREPRDLVGRTIYVVPGPGATHHAMAARWLRRNGIEPSAVEWAGMAFADQFAAMGNRAIEVGVQTEPLHSAGLARGLFHTMATQDAMDSTAVILYLMFWSGIDQLGPRVGERFLTAYLRGARDYVNAFEYGIDQDAVIDILVRETLVKDPEVYRRIQYQWVDPNGVVSRAAIEDYAEWFRELGVTSTVFDLSQAFDDRYRQLAVQHLGEYQPPH